jgi:hypothetical protein
MNYIEHFLLNKGGTIMTKHTLVMKTPDFFMLRDYLVQKRQQGVFDNNKLLMDFYKAFAVEAYIELPRKVKN